MIESIQNILPIESTERKPLSKTTRQVYNLFQDLWNKAMGFLERCRKKVQKTVQSVPPWQMKQLRCAVSK